MLWMPQGFQPSRAAFDPQPAGGADVAFDAASSATSDGNFVASKTWSHTTAADANAGIVCTWNYNTANSGVTWGGNAMTEVDAAANYFASADQYMQVWRIANPPTGAQNIVATCSGTAIVRCLSRSFKNADTAEIVRGGTVIEAEGSSGTAAGVGNVTTVAGDMAVDFLSASAGVIATEDASQTEGEADGVTGSAANIRLQGSYELATGVTTAMTWTKGAETAWWSRGFAIKKA